VKFIAIGAVEADGGEDDGAWATEIPAKQAPTIRENNAIFMMANSFYARSIAKVDRPRGKAA
jgi:hypothetical protein